MMIARWHVHARFGHKQAVIALLQRWWRDIAPQIGWSPEQARILAAALGDTEAAIEVEIEIDDLAALNDAWSKLARAEGQEAWADALEPHVVSGTPRWTVHRVV